MATADGAPGPAPPGTDHAAASAKLLRRIEALEQEKRDLELMLETATQHADHLQADLEQERNDLATMLEMTTAHADTVEDELHESAAAALIKSARQLRMIVEATPAPILISRMADGEIVFVNAMMAALMAAPSQELLGTRILDLYLDPADRAPLLEMLREQQFVDHQEVRFKRGDGSQLWVDVSLRLLDFNDEPSILSALHDITERRQAEQRLKEQVDALRLELEETGQSAELARSTGTTRFQNLDAAAIEQGSTLLVGVHSYRGGNGKSSLAANLAGLWAAAGQRVGVVDADLQSPGMHVLLGLAGRTIDHTLNDYLLGNCGIHQLAVDVTASLGQAVPGQLFLVAASVDPGAMAQILSQGYDAERLGLCYRELAKLLKLDVLLIDTHPGLNEEALLTMRAVQTLLVVLRPDAQDLEGTGVTVQIARQLEVPQVLLLVNQLHEATQAQAVRSRVEQTFGCEVAAVLPQLAEFSAFDNAGAFALRHPGHPLTVSLQRVCTRVCSPLARTATSPARGGAPQ